MKNIVSIILMLTISTGLFAGKGLVVTQKYTDPAHKGATISVTWYVTETQCKMQMAYKDDKMNTTSYFIPDVANNRLLTFSDGAAPGAPQKTYYTVPVQDIAGDHEGGVVTVTQTGETKTIGGMLCQKVVVKTGASTTEMWITKDFKSDFYKFHAYFESSYELMGLSEKQLQGVPLESVTKDSGGNVINAYEFVSEKQSDLSATDFTVPADYKGYGTTGK
jgi:hypothetical protein